MICMYYSKKERILLFCINSLKAYKDYWAFKNIVIKNNHSHLFPYYLTNNPCCILQARTSRRSSEKGITFCPVGWAHCSRMARGKRIKSEDSHPIQCLETSKAGFLTSSFFPQSGIAYKENVCFIQGPTVIAVILL